MSIYWVMQHALYLLFADSHFHMDMDPLKLLVSVIRNTAYLQKRMDVKEEELCRERELSETYKKRSLGMSHELHTKEMQIKKIQSMKIEYQSCTFLCVYYLMRILITLYVKLMMKRCIQRKFHWRLKMSTKETK